jgi:thiol:disulfide interchange protein DsbD
VAGVGAVALAVWLAVPQRAESAIRWQPFEAASVDAARSAARPALVDFMATWCIPCNEMEHTTYADPEVREQAERFAMFKADITRESEETTAIVERYAVHGVPTVILIDREGNEVRRLVGYVGPDEMVAAMRAVP